MKNLKTLKVGLSFINIVWLTAALIRLINTQTLNRFWIQVALLVIIILILAYYIGEVIERIEEVYLLGQYLASGKFTIGKQKTLKNIEE